MVVRGAQQVRGRWRLTRASAVALLAGLAACATGSGSARQPRQPDRREATSGAAQVSSLHLDLDRPWDESLWEAAREAGRPVVIEPGLWGQSEFHSPEPLPWSAVLEGLDLVDGCRRAEVEGVTLLFAGEPDMRVNDGLRVDSMLPFLAAYAGLGTVLDPGEGRTPLFDGRPCTWSELLADLEQQTRLVTCTRDGLVLARPRERGRFAGRDRPPARWRAPQLTARADCRLPTLDLSLCHGTLGECVAALSSAGVPVRLEGDAARAAPVTVHLLNVPAEQIVELLAWTCDLELARRADGYTLTNPRPGPELSATFRDVRLDLAFQALARVDSSQVLVTAGASEERGNAVLHHVPSSQSVPALADVWDLPCGGGPGAWRIGAPAPDRESVPGPLDWQWAEGREEEPPEVVLLRRVAWALYHDDVLEATAALTQIEARIEALERDDQERLAEALRTRSDPLRDQARRLTALLASAPCRVQGTITGEEITPLAVIDDVLLAVGDTLPGRDGRPAVVLLAVHGGTVTVRVGELELTR